MEVANEIMKQVVPILMTPFNRYIRYFISCTMYVRDMSIKMAVLTAARVGVEEHMVRNNSNRLEVPTQVEGWLKDVGEIMEEAEKVPRDVTGCFNLKIRHKAGRNASNIIQKIDSLMTIHSLINWVDHPIPLGRVDTMKAFTSTSSTKHNDFESREVTFTEALQALEPNHKGHMVALCGMGGVGKTTMMERLKKVVAEKRMLKYIVKVVIGEKTDPIAIQEAVANYLSIELKETIKSARAERLHNWFKDNSDGGKTKFLIVLDDVWQSVDLNDIGLSPLPNQGVNFKVLLTSRDTHACSEMGVEANSILNVQLLTEAEAQSLFHQISEPADSDLHKIGDNIARKCCGLPIAIKTMALALRNKSKDAWNDALSRLEDHDIENVVNEVFKMSYRNLQDEETKCIFLLCGLFPEDFDIPLEELVRYGWGLHLFKKVNTIRRARARLHACIERLMDSNLLIKSIDVGCIKMHDLVRAFVLDMFSKVEHAAIVSHGSMSGWPENNMSASCNAISLTCEGMSEFPADLKFPNLLILKLMHGDKWLRNPQDFYGEMQKLQVLSYDKMKYPVTPSSPQCSINLRVLHLHECSLIFDCSSIGNLLNLEVLSFANSGIKWLPSTLGNLKKLRLLDLTNCDGLYIENGVLKNMVKLEELYMRVSGEKAINSTDENCNEMALRSENLSVVEFEFFQNNAQPKNMLFEKLERFKISVGRYLDGDFSDKKHSFENTLQLVTNKCEIFESRMNGLFEKTEVLCLNVGDMNDLSDVELKSSNPLHSSTFYNLRVLVVSDCAELRYLFTLGVAKAMSKLEHLQVKSCNNMEELVHTGGSGEEKITFPKLKFLSLYGLEKLSGLCDNVNVIELSQLMELELKYIPGFTASLLKEEIVIPKLEKLCIGDMENLKEIWPSELSRLEKLKLGEIQVRSCNNLVNLFPCNPMSLIHHLEELEVFICGSIEVLFKIDLDSDIVETGEGSSSSSLRRIEVERLGKLREVWRIKGADDCHLPICGFQAVESIHITECERFRNVFTPITTNFDLGALVEISTDSCGENGRNNESAESCQGEEQLKSLSKEETARVSYSFSDIVLPSLLIPSFHKLRKLELRRFKGVEVLFNMKSRKSGEPVKTCYDQQRLFPYLEELDISSMDSMRCVWKCNWNKFLEFQKQQSEYPFHNLTTISLFGCRSFKYLFSPVMAKLLSNLKRVKIQGCRGIEEVVSDRDDKDDEKTTSTSSYTSTTLFPHLDSIILEHLGKLTRIGGGGSVNSGNNEISFDSSTTTTAFVDQLKFSEAGGVSWTLCQYSREISISGCTALSSVIPCYAVGQMQKLEVLKIGGCMRMKEVFELKGMNNNKSGCDEGNGGIPRVHNVLMLPNLKKLIIDCCVSLEHLLTFSALESLSRLEELEIRDCYEMKVIVKEEDEYGEQTTITKASSSKEVVVFPRLKSIKLLHLQGLVGFVLGNNEFRWPSLDYVMINDCPKMAVFAPGWSTAPQLKYIHTHLGKYTLEKCGLNFQVTTAALHQIPFQSSHPATSEGMPWSFRNLIEVDVSDIDYVETIIPSNGFLQLQKLEKIYISTCYGTREVFESFKAGTNSSGGSDDSQTTLVKLPNLTQVELDNLDGLRNIWKSNQWTVFEFPNLTRLSIDDCPRLKHVFSSSMVGSLLQLQELSITCCDRLKDIIAKDANLVVQEKEEKGEEEEEEEEEFNAEEEEESDKEEEEEESNEEESDEEEEESNEEEEEEKEEEESDGKINEIIVLPQLRSLTLDRLPSLKGFCVGKEDFSFPLLDTLIIKKCPAIKILTKGNSATPLLKLTETNFGCFYGGEDINSFIKIKQEEFRKGY